MRRAFEKQKQLRSFYENVEKQEFSRHPNKRWSDLRPQGSAFSRKMRKEIAARRLFRKKARGSESIFRARIEAARGWRKQHRILVRRIAIGVRLQRLGPRAPVRAGRAPGWAPTAGIIRRAEAEGSFPGVAKNPNPPTHFYLKDGGFADKLRG